MYNQNVSTTNVADLNIFGIFFLRQVSQILCCRQNGSETLRYEHNIDNWIKYVN